MIRKPRRWIEHFRCHLARDHGHQIAIERIGFENYVKLGCVVLDDFRVLELTAPELLHIGAIHAPQTAHSEPYFTTPVLPPAEEAIEAAFARLDHPSGRRMSVREWAGDELDDPHHPSPFEPYGVREPWHRPQLLSIEPYGAREGMGNPSCNFCMPGHPCKDHGKPR